MKDEQTYHISHDINLHATSAIHAGIIQTYRIKSPPQPSPLYSHPPLPHLRQFPERARTNVQIRLGAAGAAVHDGEVDRFAEAGSAEAAAAEGVGVGVCGGRDAVEEEVGDGDDEVAGKEGAYEFQEARERGREMRKRGEGNGEETLFQ